MPKRQCPPTPPAAYQSVGDIAHLAVGVAQVREYRTRQTGSRLDDVGLWVRKFCPRGSAVCLRVEVPMSKRTPANQKARLWGVL
jgi:hypothetical protein